MKSSCPCLLPPTILNVLLLDGLIMLILLGLLVSDLRGGLSGGRRKQRKPSWNLSRGEGDAAAAAAAAHLAQSSLQITILHECVHMRTGSDNYFSNCAQTCTSAKKGIFCGDKICTVRLESWDQDLLNGSLFEEIG